MVVQNDLKPSSRTLRLDTGNTRPALATLSIPPESRSHSNSHSDWQAATKGTTHNSYLGQVSSEFPTTDLLDALEEKEESTHGDILHVEDVADAASEDAVDSKYSSHAPAQDKSTRRPSVSFSSHATLDDGMRLSLQAPPPEVATSASSRTRMRGASLTNNSDREDLQSSLSSPRINPFTGEPVRRRARRSDRPARSAATEPGQDYDDSQDHMSGSADSSYFETNGTPMSTSMTGSMLFSPHAFASPSISPAVASDPWPMSAHGSLKSRLVSRHSSLRNSSRRSSRLSGSSPASAFLSQWGKESLASIAPDPDDEGQTIGLDGEYIIGRQIGYGGFSVVKELHGLSESGENIQRAVKIVRKAIPNISDAENDTQQQTFEHEVSIWRYLHHSHILPLHAVYDTDFATFCVMDLIEGGTLFDLVRKMRSTSDVATGLTPLLAKHYAYQLASALRYLHEDIRIVHRDVKLENCLLDFGASNADTKGAKVGQLKLCDFGLADFVSSNDLYDSTESLDATSTFTTTAGTLQYAAPENFSTTRRDRSLLQPALDIWAFGVCVYTLLTGEMPFRHALQPKIIEMITSGSWDREALRKAWRNGNSSDSRTKEKTQKAIEESVIDLLDGCLEHDPTMRWTISDVLASNWFSDLSSEEQGDGGRQEEDDGYERRVSSGGWDIWGGD